MADLPGAAVEAAAIAERVRREERAAIARMVRHYFAAVDDPLYEDVRILCERIERGEHLPARTTGADQPAAEPITPPKTAPEMRCSECGRPLVGQPCGLVHAVARMQSEENTYRPPGRPHSRQCLACAKIRAQSRRSTK